MRSILLATAIVAVLGFTAASQEEPATHAAPAANATENADVCYATMLTFKNAPAKWTFCGLFDNGYVGTAIVVLMLAMLVYFVLGLAKHRHDWKPFVLGLFVLGFGLLGATVSIMGALDGFAEKGNPADVAFAIGFSLPPVVAGLAAALLGGLFTVILRWRNERFRSQEPGK